MYKFVLLIFLCKRSMGNQIILKKAKECSTSVRHNLKPIIASFLFIDCCGSILGDLKMLSFSRPSSCLIHSLTPLTVHEWDKEMCEILGSHCRELVISKTKKRKIKVEEILIRIDYCMLGELYCFIVRTKIAGGTPIIFSLLIFSLFSHLYRHFRLNGHLPLRAISILTELSVSRFMRSDVKMNLLVKLFSPEGKKLNHFFFVLTLSCLKINQWIKLGMVNHE